MAKSPDYGTGPTDCFVTADATETQQCQEDLVNTLKSAGEQTTTDYQWDSGLDQTYRIKSDGLWWRLKEKDTTYTHEFGIGSSKANPVCQISFPVHVDNKHTTGSIVKDDKGRYYIAHTGHFNTKGAWTSIDDFSKWSKGRICDQDYSVLLISALDEELVENLDQFVRFVENVKKKYREPTESNINAKEYSKILEKKGQIIFYGPPGTGKTYNALQLAEYFVRTNSNMSLTFKSAAINILKKAENPMHYEEILSKILNQGLVQTAGKTPERTIMTTISRDIRHKGANSIFRKTDSGTYSLNPQADDYETKIGSRSPSKDKDEFIRNVTFHPSYSYEEFVEGLRPKLSDDGNVAYVIESGIFKTICKDAEEDENNRYVLIIDEINRGNVAKIFGELITLIEKDKRGSNYTTTLPYSKQEFSVPSNLFLIGTMNTADRSLTQLDTALRRRFGFCELLPNYRIINQKIGSTNLKDLLKNINEKIKKHGWREKQIGHSYFMEDGKPIESMEKLQLVFATDIIPLLQDYFYEDYDELSQILGDTFIDKNNKEVKRDWKDNMEKFEKSIEGLKNDKNSNDNERTNRN